MKTVTAQELLILDERLFYEEYYKWHEYCPDYEWWDYIEENLKETLAHKGIWVDNMDFRLSYSQGDYATFEGSIDVGTWMQTHMDRDVPYADKFPALFIAIQNYGARAGVNVRNRSCRGSVCFDACLAGNTEPDGIFEGLDQEGWDELIADQLASAGLEEAMQDDVEAISRQLYNDLQSEYEHLTSKESFIESCECNEITFDIETEEEEEELA